MDEISDVLWRRIRQTVAVRDTDVLPKVPEAGHVVERNGKRVQVMHNGVVVREGCYYGTWMTEIIRQLNGHHEPQEELAFHTVVTRLATDTEAPTMMELGSFWAYYSLWAKRLMPATRLVLVEPDRSNLQAGLENLELNGVEPAAVVNAAVGSAHDSTVSLRSESDGSVHDTRVVSVDGLMAELGIDRVDLLLCDTQGAEIKMLDGASAALASKRIRFLVISTHHHTISGDPLTHQRCVESLRSAGAHIIAEHSVSESCSGDGLAVVSMDPRDRDLHAQVSIVRARDSLFGELEYDLAAAIRASHACDDRLGDD